MYLTYNTMVLAYKISYASRLSCHITCTRCTIADWIGAKLDKVLVNRHKVQFGSIINLVKGGHAMHRCHTSHCQRTRSV